MTAAEALQLGIVDQVTEHNTVDVAVKFALSVTGEAKKKRGNKKNEVAPLSLLWRRRSTQSSYSGLVRHQDVLTYGWWKSGEAENKTGRSSSTEAINVSWACQRRSDVFTAFAVLFRREKRDKLSWNINSRSSPNHLFKDRLPGL